MLSNARWRKNRLTTRAKLSHDYSVNWWPFDGFQSQLLFILSQLLFVGFPKPVSSLIWHRGIAPIFKVSVASPVGGHEALTIRLPTSSFLEREIRDQVQAARVSAASVVDEFREYFHAEANTRSINSMRCILKFEDQPARHVQMLTDSPIR
jgi:hypothetical protein